MIKKLLILSLFILLFFIESYAMDYYTGKNPTKAMFLSLFIPGAGQFYNEQYWKAGTVFIVESTMLGFTIYNNHKMNEYYDKAKSATDEAYHRYYQKYNDYYEKRQNMYWWLGGFTFLSIVDAFVNAHLYNYDEEKRKIELRFGENKAQIKYTF
ncbi:MAG: hypothetical protein DRH57_03075 [Candidatus Cloacimonadota bacterium]|nr:MAG: hypothetical protein DRH57_03075 [Candidatus Cloacimonadota bacterium]